jgi:hypothetical protein
MADIGCNLIPDTREFCRTADRSAMAILSESELALNSRCKQWNSPGSKLTVPHVGLFGHPPMAAHPQTLGKPHIRRIKSFCAI